MKDTHQVIRKVRISEKATMLKEKQNQVVFVVSRDATKIEIKTAVEKAFGKKVVSVRTANYDGKLKRKRTASQGRTAHWKKAIVSLAQGETLDLI